MGNPCQGACMALPARGPSPLLLPHAAPRTWDCLIRSACGAVLRGCEQVAVDAPCEGVTAALSPGGLVVEGSGSSLGSLCLLPLGWCLAGAPFACRWVCMSSVHAHVWAASGVRRVRDCAWRVWSCVNVRGVCVTYIVAVSDGVSFVAPTRPPPPVSQAGARVPPGLPAARARRRHRGRRRWLPAVVPASDGAWAGSRPGPCVPVHRPQRGREGGRVRGIAAAPCCC